MEQRYTGDINIYNKIVSKQMFSGTKAEKPVISFCIPAYKRANTLHEAIKSIIGQKYEHSYEIIVCDNSGNTTESNEILAVAKEFIDYPIKLFVNEQNLGMTGNWNRLIQLSAGDYIAFLHDDDLLAEDYHELIDHLINRADTREISPFGFLKVQFQEFTDGTTLPYISTSDKTVRCSYMRDSLISGIGPTTTPTCGMLFSRDALLSVNGFCEEYYPCADHIIGFVLEEKGYKGYISSGKYSYYRWGANETRNIKTQVQTYEKNTQIRQYFYQHSSLYHLFGKLFEKAQRSLNLQAIYAYCRQGNPDIAITDIEKEPIQASRVLVMILRLIRKSNRSFRAIRKAL